MNAVINNINNIYNTQNEYMTHFSINRNVRKLLENDIEIYKRVFSITENSVVTMFNEDKVYDIGDLVWFIDTHKRLWLLRKTVNYTGFKEDPNLAIKEDSDNPTFEKYGWKNENEYIDMLDYGAENKIKQIITTVINEHENDKIYHKYGKLDSEETFQEKIMLNDMSNIQRSRSNIFFPNTTIRLSSDDTILNGYARIWDKGLLEYDIIYRLGYCGEEDGYEILSCNNYTPSYDKNKNYFSTSLDCEIFNNRNGIKTYSSIIGNMKQLNRNDYVNTYSGKIQFPTLNYIIDNKSCQIQFQDTNYMIFGSGLMSQDRDLSAKCLNSSMNQMTFCDKSINGFTALLITFPSNGHYVSKDAGYNAKNGGLVSNSFHCHIIGKWKVQE